LPGHEQLGLQQSCIVVVVNPDENELAVAAVVALGSGFGSPWPFSLHPVTRVSAVGHSTRFAFTFQLM
jgi:hypothetical protein